MNTVWSPQWARGLFLVGQLDVFAIGQSEDLDTMIAAGQSEDQDKVFTICSRSEDLDTVFDIGKSEDHDVELNVLGCGLIYQGQTVTNACAWFNVALRPQKP